MEKDKFDKHLKEIQGKTLSKEKQLHKIHKHKSVLKKRKLKN